MGEETKIIMPTQTLDKEKLTEDEKDALLSDEFRMGQDHAQLEMAKDGIPEDHFKGDEHMLKPPGEGPEITSAPLVRGKMLGEAQGMKARLPLETRAAAVTEDSSLDDVPPMKRAQIIASRPYTKEG